MVLTIVIDEIRHNSRRGKWGRATVVGRHRNKVYWEADPDMDIQLSSIYEAEAIEYPEDRITSTKSEGYRAGVRIIREDLDFY